MKIALCLYGQPRFLDNPLAFHSIQTHILNCFDTDVFCHFWHDEDKNFFNRSDFSKAYGGCSADYMPYICKDAEKKIVDFFSPKAYICEKSRTFSIPDENLLTDALRNYPSNRDENISNMKSQLYSWQKVLEIFEQNKGNCEYDWVIVTRYDLVISNLPHPPGFIKNRTYGHGTCDIVAIEPKLCKHIKPYDQFDIITPRVNSFDAAEYKRISIQNAGSNLDLNEGWVYKLVRSNLESGILREKIDQNINILIPMAGGGKRFIEFGYKMPKPLIDVNGKPMIQAVLESMNLNGNYIFITRDYENEEDNENLKTVLKNFSKDCKIISIPHITRGAAETCLLAKEFIDNDNPLIITNCDQIFNWNVNEFINYAKEKDADGLVAVFDSNDTKYSYIKVNEENIGVELAEKIPISNNALTGFHFWNSGSSFVRSAEKMIELNQTHNGEFYVAPTYNFLIQEGKKILYFMTSEKETEIIGTPEELKKYLDKTK